MEHAIGMIETRGLVPLIEASDAMAKAANAKPASATNLRISALPFYLQPQAWPPRARTLCFPLAWKSKPSSDGRAR